MADAVVIDTDVLIDCLRGRAEASGFLQELEHVPMISDVSVSELFAGVRDAERDSLDQFLLAMRVVPVSSDIARTGGLYRRDFGPGHGTGLVDGIIAATASATKARLVTLNRRHYPMLDEVIVPY